jgi:hypothetical protein
MIASDLTDKLVEQSPKIAIVDRSQRDFVLRENQLADEKLMDPETRKRLGKLIGVDTIVVGSATAVRDGTSVQIRIQARAVEVETARIIAVGSAAFIGTDTLFDWASLTTQGEGDATGAKMDSGPGIFSNRILVIRPKAVQIAKDYGNARDIVATAELENISGHDMWIGLAYVQIGRCSTHYIEGSGIAVRERNTSRFEHYAMQDRRRALTEFPAGGKILISAMDQTCVEETSASLSQGFPVLFEFIADYEGQFEKFSISIPQFSSAAGFRYTANGGR